MCNVPSASRLVKAQVFYIMTQYQVKDAGDPRKYFYQIPNMIDEIGLSVYAHRLYCHLKRVAGDDGKCWKSTQTLAKDCVMSTASVSRAKIELQKLELIEIEQQPNEHGGRAYHVITVTDIWEKNLSSYSQKQQVTTSNLQDSPQKLASYPQKLKKNPIKKNPEEVVGDEPTPWTPIEPPAPELLSPATSIDSIVCDATGISCIPPTQLDRSEQIRSLVSTYGRAQVIDAFKTSFQKWIKTKKKSGGGTYSPLNFGWVDWAQESLLGISTEPQKAWQDMNPQELVEYYASMEGKE